MATLRRWPMRVAVKSMETIEKSLDFLFVARPYIPFAAMSLLAGFIIGIILVSR